MKKTLLFLLALFLGVGIIVCDKPVSVSSAEAKVYEWKLQHDGVRGDVITDLLIDFSKDVEKRSNGQLKIKIFADPEIVPAFEILQAVIAGTLQMSNTSGLFQAGQIPISAVEFGLPMIYKFPEFNNDFMKEANAIRDFFFSSGMVDLLRKEYGKFGVYWLDMHAYGPAVIFSTKPIKTIDDFKGKKMFTVPQFATWLEKMGGAPAEPAGGDLFMNLKLGTLDTVEWDINGVTALRYFEAAPYVHIGLYNSQMIGHWEVNMKAWNSLPDDLKQVLKDATKDWWAYKNKAVDKIEREAYKMAEKGEFTLQKMDATSQSKMLEYAKEAWDEWAKHDKASAKAVALQKEWYKTR